MTDITILTKAGGKTKSLRVTVPIFIVKHFNLKNGDRFEWNLIVGSDEKISIRLCQKKVKNNNGNENKRREI
jgi:hypothetical protein